MKDNQYASEPFTAERDALCDHSGEELLHECCRELGVNMDMALQIVAWADDRWGTINNEKIIQNEDGAALKALENKHRQAWLVLRSYQQQQKTLADMLMSTRVMALELGYYSAAGADTVAKLARLTGFQKQTLNKCSLHFQSKLGLPSRPGQRGGAERVNMRKARAAQLKETETAAESML